MNNKILWEISFRLSQIIEQLSSFQFNRSMNVAGAYFLPICIQRVLDYWEKEKKNNPAIKNKELNNPVSKNEELKFKKKDLGIEKKNLEVEKQIQRFNRIFGRQVNHKIFDGWDYSAALKMFNEKEILNPVPDIHDADNLILIKKFCYSAIAGICELLKGNKTTDDIDNFHFSIMKIFYLASKAEGYWEAKNSEFKKMVQANVRKMTKKEKNIEAVVSLLKKHKGETIAFFNEVFSTLSLSEKYIRYEIVPKALTRYRKDEK